MLVPLLIVHVYVHIRKYCRGKSFRIQERLKLQSGEESSSSGCFNSVGRLLQLGCLYIQM